MGQAGTPTGVLEIPASRSGRIEPVLEETTAPADRYRLPDGTVFGIIASTTAPFCATCDRSRLTADGVWYLCLYALRGTDLRGPLRRGATREELAGLITGRWRQRADRGAEERLALRERAPRGVGVLALSDGPAFFVHGLRELLNAGPFASLALQSGFVMFGRTYASGFETDLEDWLLRRPRRAVLNPAWPWGIWYPLRRT